MKTNNMTPEIFYAKLHDLASEYTQSCDYCDVNGSWIIEDNNNRHFIVEIKIHEL